MWREVNRMKTNGSIFVSIVLGIGCASNVDTFKQDTLPRASFELSCPKEQLTVTELSYTEMGVDGCGKKVVFVYVRGQGWVNNTASAK